MGRLHLNSRFWILALCAVAGVLLLWMGGRASDGNRTDAGEPPSAAETKDRLERDLAALLGQIEGVGEATLFTRFEEGKLCGVAVLCSGGGNAQVRRTVTELICALYGIGSHRIYVGCGIGKENRS